MVLFNKSYGERSQVVKALLGSAFAVDSRRSPYVTLFQDKHLNIGLNYSFLLDFIRLVGRSIPVNGISRLSFKQRNN